MEVDKLNHYFQPDLVVEFFLHTDSINYSLNCNRLQANGFGLEPHQSWFGEFHNRCEIKSEQQ